MGSVSPIQKMIEILVTSLGVEKYQITEAQSGADLTFKSGVVNISLLNVDVIPMGEQYSASTNYEELKKLETHIIQISTFAQNDVECSRAISAINFAFKNQQGQRIQSLNGFLIARDPFRRYTRGLFTFDSKDSYHQKVVEYKVLVGYTLKHTADIDYYESAEVENLIINE